MSSFEKTPLLPDNGNKNNSSETYASLDSKHHGSPLEVSSDYKHPPVEPATNNLPHSIGAFGSLALIMNNMTGPAMLGFPHLFQQAGLIPVVIGIIFVSMCSSLCGTFLADTIASIPGNHHFQRKVDFSSAFRLTVGESWYKFAESLFLLACAVQACAAIVESAQSVDGFIASFVFGKTYGLQLYPSVEFIEWSTSSCHMSSANETESKLEDCTPFHGAGDLILTLGFLITTAIFLPLGRGHLQETISIQIFSFICMIILLSQFSYEFIKRGFQFSLPLVGKDVSQLAGVVLFNYAFSITVPSWLTEKNPSVSVNRTIWTASTMASLIYILFGIMGAMSFDDVSVNMLVLLTSGKVHILTRLCAALFGVTIIGCGVPVFCVIIKNALEFNQVCSPFWASFMGSIGPYAISWMLYQGTLLMSMLNWTGLVVNGLVAFLLPMVLALKSTELKWHPRPKHINIILQGDPNFAKESIHEVGLNNSNEAVEAMVSDDQQHKKHIELAIIHPPSSSTLIRDDNNEDIEENKHSKEFSQLNNHNEMTFHSQELNQNISNRMKEIRLISNATVQPLPINFEIYRREIVLFMMLAFATIIIITIMEDAIEGITPVVDENKYRRMLYL